MRALLERVPFLVSLVAVAALGGACSDPDPLAGCEICRDGCGAGACVVECASAGCNDRIVRCPAGQPCELTCTGLDACDTTTVECPDGFACTVRCEGRDACGDMILQCGTSDCSIECGSDAAACEGAAVNCGSGACTATCLGTSQPAMTGCDMAASCTQC